MNRLSNRVGPCSGSVMLYQTVVNLPLSVRRALDCVITQFDFVTCSLTVGLLHCEATEADLKEIVTFVVEVSFTSGYKSRPSIES